MCCCGASWDMESRGVSLSHAAGRGLGLRVAAAVALAKPQRTPYLRLPHLSHHGEESCQQDMADPQACCTPVSSTVPILQYLR